MSDSRAFPISIVDVFAEQPLAGNQLAVVHNAAGLSDAEMQAITLEMNFSETTFITANDAGRAAVRIFSPLGELPFAGHPTIGTAWEITRGQADITLALAAGDVPVSYSDGVGWLTSPPVTTFGEVDIETAAKVVGLTPTEFDDALPITVLEVGPRFVMLPLKNRAALKSARLNVECYEKLNADTGVQCVFLFTADPHFEKSDYAARMLLATNAGVCEDPATGSANAAFAHYLREQCNTRGRVVVDQGVEMNRPSRLYLNIDDDEIKVGGKVRPVLRGEITPFAEPK